MGKPNLNRFSCLCARIFSPTDASWHENPSIIRRNIRVSKSAAKLKPEPQRGPGRPKASEGMMYPIPEMSGGRVLIDPRQCAKRVGCHPITLYRWMKNIPDFPRPIRISPNRIAFFDDEVTRYIDTRPRV
jgi:predicted DNA-binding transcriptional regulator AlpA